jgi:hypothetical protein
MTGNPRAAEMDAWAADEDAREVRIQALIDEAVDSTPREGSPAGLAPAGRATGGPPPRPDQSPGPRPD